LIQDVDSLQNLASTVFAAETRAYVITNLLVRALAGDIITLHPVAAFVTVNISAEHASEAILGKSFDTVAFMIELSCVPFVPSLNVPPTSSFDPGLVTQIPTSPPDSIRIFSVPLVPIRRSIASEVPT
jgi:hypothetical protein